MASVAVVAHARKSLGGGLPELREILAREGVTDPLWYGDRRRLDTGSVNGERFTVMAGAGFDARMISDADRGTKDRLGRAAYVVTGVRNLGARRGKLSPLP